MNPKTPVETGGTGILPVCTGWKPVLSLVEGPVPPSALLDVAPGSVLHWPRKDLKALHTTQLPVSGSVFTTARAGGGNPPGRGGWRAPKKQQGAAPLPQPP